MSTVFKPKVRQAHKPLIPTSEPSHIQSWPHPHTHTQQNTRNFLNATIYNYVSIASRLYAMNVLSSCNGQKVAIPPCDDELETWILVDMFAGASAWVIHPSRHTGLSLNIDIFSRNKGLHYKLIMGMTILLRRRTCIYSETSTGRNYTQAKFIQHKLKY